MWSPGGLGSGWSPKDSSSRSCSVMRRTGNGPPFDRWGVLSGSSVRSMGRAPLDLRGRQAGDRLRSSVVVTTHTPATAGGDSEIFQDLEVFAERRAYDEGINGARRQTPKETFTITSRALHP